MFAVQLSSITASPTGDFPADLSSNPGHRLFEFLPRVSTNEAGRAEIELTVPSADVWTSVLTAMSAIRQSGYSAAALHVTTNDNSDETAWRHEAGVSENAVLGERCARIRVWVIRSGRVRNPFAHNLPRLAALLEPVGVAASYNGARELALVMDGIGTPQNTALVDEPERARDNL